MNEQGDTEQSVSLSVHREALRSLFDSYRRGGAWEEMHRGPMFDAWCRDIESKIEAAIKAELEQQVDQFGKDNHWLSLEREALQVKVGELEGALRIVCDNLWRYLGGRSNRAKALNRAFTAAVETLPVKDGAAAVVAEQGAAVRGENASLIEAVELSWVKNEIHTVPEVFNALRAALGAPGDVK